MNGWLAFAVLIGLVGTALIVRLRARERRRAREVFDLATTLEGRGEYESACFHYAVARNAGADPRVCEASIQDLWERKGPFDFASIGATLRATYCRHRSCGEGYHQIIVADIRRLVGGGRDAHSAVQHMARFRG